VKPARAAEGAGELGETRRARSGAGEVGEVAGERYVSGELTEVDVLCHGPSFVIDFRLAVEGTVQVPVVESNRYSLTMQTRTAGRVLGYFILMGTLVAGAVGCASPVGSPGGASDQDSPVDLSA